jgi:hypothetical protein
VTEHTKRDEENAQSRGDAPLSSFWFKPGNKKGGYNRAHRDAFAEVFAREVVHTTEIMHALRAAALEGDSTAARTWLGRMFGPEQAPNFDVPVTLNRQATPAEVIEVATQVLAQDAAALLEAGKERRLTDDEIKRVLQVIAILGKAPSEDADGLSGEQLAAQAAPLLERYGYSVTLVAAKVER